MKTNAKLRELYPDIYCGAISNLTEYLKFQYVLD